MVIKTDKAAGPTTELSPRKNHCDLPNPVAFSRPSVNQLGEQVIGCNSFWLFNRVKIRKLLMKFQGTKPPNNHISQMQLEHVVLHTLV